MTELYFMKDCVHWKQKEYGECPYEENPINCNGCQDYIVSKGGEPEE